ncbi:MAG: hypothetical protein J6M30_08170 [Bacteroidales bacterium]|nr:hypothetical protein [Bacteroidales bacterium]
MDTTYWGRNFGVVVFKDKITKKILWRKFIYRKEHISDYTEGILWLKEHSFNILGIVCDGLKGLFKELDGYKIQMCQYHQIKITERYLTLSPETIAGQELLQLVKEITCMDKESFIGAFDAWNSRWNYFYRNIV